MSLGVLQKREVGPSLWVRRPHTAPDRTVLCAVAAEPFENSGIRAVHTQQFGVSDFTGTCRNHFLAHTT